MPDAADHSPPSTAERLYPEISVGGYTRHDGFVEFYFRINTLLTPESVVLDFGAGRGQWADPDVAPVHRNLRDLQAKAAKVVGVDVDPVVLTNENLDESHVIEVGGSLPFEDETFDVVIADHVLEHVSAEDSHGVAEEMYRVLRPGGWFTARTPNKWGVIGLGARLVPNRFHVRVLSKVQRSRLPQDVFPTRYSMNTPQDLRRLFPADRWELVVYTHASEPQYAGSTSAGWRAASFVDRLTPPPMRPTLMIFARKRP